MTFGFPVFLSPEFEFISLNASKSRLLWSIALNLLASLVLGGVGRNDSFLFEIGEKHYTNYQLYPLQLYGSYFHSYLLLINESRRSGWKFCLKLIFFGLEGKVTVWYKFIFSKCLMFIGVIELALWASNYARCYFCVQFTYKVLNYFKAFGASKILESFLETLFDPMNELDLHIYWF